MAVAAPTIIQKPAHPNNYTVGRVGGRNGQHTFHHVVGSADSAAAVFQNPSRQASATYIVTATPGVVYQAVSEANTSWADGNLASNRRSITVEHHGDWRNGYRNETVIQNAAQLVAWLRDRGIVNHYYRHRDVSSVYTLCSADLPVEEIWNRATQIINSSNTPTPPPVTKADLVWEKLAKPVTYVFNKQTNLWNFNATTHAGMISVKTFAKGDRVDIYGKVTNKSVGSTYLLTEYSYTQKITNGFNQADLDIYVAPAPVPTKPEWERNLKDIAPVKLQVLTTQTPIVNLLDGSIVKQLGGGTWVDFVKTTTVGGVEYLISSWSAEHAVANGIKRADVGVPETPGNEKPEWLEKWYDIEDVDMYTRADTDLVNLEDGSTVKVIPRGEKIRVASMTEWFGHKYAITQYSTEKKEGRGIRLDDLDLKPVTEEPTAPAPEQPPIETIDKNVVTAFLEMIVKLISEFINKLKGDK
jgi:hypothetical protein